MPKFCKLKAAGVGGVTGALLLTACSISLARRVIGNDRCWFQQDYLWSVSDAVDLDLIPQALGRLLAGPLADYMFEPAMMPEGNLAPIFREILALVLVGWLFCSRALCMLLVESVVMRFT